MERDQPVRFRKDYDLSSIAYDCHFCTENASEIVKRMCFNPKQSHRNVLKCRLRLDYFSVNLRRQGTMSYLSFPYRTAVCQSLRLREAKSQHYDASSLHHGGSLKL